MPWMVCMHRWNLFLSKRECFKAQWLKVEPKQSTLFLSIQISFLIMKEEVHAIGEVECEVTLAWQTCESISFCKEIFFLETK